MERWRLASAAAERPSFPLCSPAQQLETKRSMGCHPEAGQAATPTSKQAAKRGKQSSAHDVPIDGGRVGRLHAVPGEPAAANVAAQSCQGEAQYGQSAVWMQQPPGRASQAGGGSQRWSVKLQPLNALRCNGLPKLCPRQRSRENSAASQAASRHPLFVTGHTGTHTQARGTHRSQRCCLGTSRWCRRLSTSDCRLLQTSMQCRRPGFCHCMGEVGAAHCCGFFKWEPKTVPPRVSQSHNTS